MKNKICEVKLVSEDINQLINWIEKIEDNFENVLKYNFKECCFYIDGLKIIDYRILIQFESQGTKNKIYEKMNSIKSNPIKFIN